ncbi:MAG: hypothetical protein EOO89_25465, partial [Pedobacter sp.]
MTDEFNTIKDAYQRNMFTSAADKIDILSLYKQLPDINILSEYEENLYHLAARFTDSDGIRFLKAAGIRPDQDKYGNTPFHSLINTRFDFDDPKLEDRVS